MYTEDQIKEYLNILHSFTHPPQNIDNRNKCRNCQSINFFIKYGHYICEECGMFNGHVLGYWDLKEYNRFHYRKKSIYQRRYHYEKKVNQISNRLNLNDDQKHELYNRLMNIDNNDIKKINKDFIRKRMINIFYIIKKLLEEMDCEKSSQIYLKISSKTLEYYEKWWESYINLKKKNLYLLSIKFILTIYNPLLIFHKIF